MKLRTLAVAAAVSACISIASSAQACVLINDCNFVGSDIPMGNLVVGQQGTITEAYQNLFSTGNTTLGFGIANGYLPTNSIIKFDYTFTGLQSNPANNLASSISYDPYTIGSNTYNGYSNASSIFGIGQQGYINGVAGVSQVFATANLPTATSGQTSIANFTRTGGNSLQYFTTTLFAYFNAAPAGTAVIRYQVIGLPLPASLSMMLLAIGGLFSFSRLSKTRKAIAA